MSNEELVRKERERREKKLYKQLEKQQKKLAAKGIHVDIDTLKKDYETQRAGGKSTLNLEAALAAAGAEGDIDVVGGIDDSFDMDSDVEGDTKTSQETQIRLKQMEADIKRKISPFSIESLLAKRQLSVQAAAVASFAANVNAASTAQQAAVQIKDEQNIEENNNPPMVSPIPTSCSSPLSRGSMTSPPPSTRYLSPSPSPASHQQPPMAPTTSVGGLHFPIPIFPSLANSSNHLGSGPGGVTASSVASSISQELSLLKPLTASPEKGHHFPGFLSKFDPSKISFSSTLASLQPEPPTASVESEDEMEDHEYRGPIYQSRVAFEAPPLASATSPASSSWTLLFSD